MIKITANESQYGLIWEFSPPSHFDEDNSIEVSFSLDIEKYRSGGWGFPSESEWLVKLQLLLSKDKKGQWIFPADGQWSFNLDSLRQMVWVYSSCEYLSGIVKAKSEVKAQPDIIDFYGRDYESYGFATIVFRFKGDVNMTHILRSPIHIQDSLKIFAKDHPEPSRAAFVMMCFGKTNQHDRIYDNVKSTFQKYGIAAVRADDKQYSDDLLSNIQTYIYGCGFGLAVFERIESEVFNPNVALEVGFMMALAKPICFLKDRSLKTLQTDLVGRLYREFDSFDPEGTIPPQIDKWVTDKHLK